jgi:alpha-glucosidase
MIDDVNLIHHDGSNRYVFRKSEDEFQLLIKIPRALEVERVALRSVKDGEPIFIEASRESSSSYYEWYCANLKIHNPRTNYRWFIGGGKVNYGWLNQSGWREFDVSDLHDFVITKNKQIPGWARESVIYQIFPDRFAKSGKKYSLPSWAVPRNWDDWPEGASPNTSFEYFGGDFWGVIDRLDYLCDLGINVLYFTPFFRAGSIHRYDAATFDEVDPLLGGNDALIALTEEAHRRGMRVIGDITLNHSGATHQWFIKALAGESPFREFYTFDESLPTGYECWLGVPSLPKFDYRSEDLRAALISGEESVLRRWLRPPFNLDGWRVDVANMSGRLRELDMTHEIARLARHAIESEGSEKILIAEHNHDACADLDGDGWHGNMNYTSFRNPAWNWLITESMSTFLPVKHGNFVQLAGPETVAVIKEFSTRQPFPSYASSWNLLSSHDSARVRSIVGSSHLHHVAIAFAMTMPGTPMIFAGDEIGEEGLWGEDSRSPFPWDREQDWDHSTRTLYKDLITLRRGSSALAFGGLQWLSVANDYLCYLRDDGKERIIALLMRAPGQLKLSLSQLECNDVEHILGTKAAITDGEINIEINTPGFSIFRLI